MFAMVPKGIFFVGAGAFSHVRSYVDTRDYCNGGAPK